MYDHPRRMLLPPPGGFFTWTPLTGCDSLLTVGAEGVSISRSFMCTGFGFGGSGSPINMELPPPGGRSTLKNIVRRRSNRLKILSL